MQVLVDKVEYGPDSANVTFECIESALGFRIFAIELVAFDPNSRNANLIEKQAHEQLLGHLSHIVDELGEILNEWE